MDNYDEDEEMKQRGKQLACKALLWVAGICGFFWLMDKSQPHEFEVNTEHRYINRDPTKDAYHIKKLDMVEGIIEYREYTPGFDFLNPSGTPKKANVNKGVTITTRLSWEEILEQLDLDEEDLLDYLNENY